MFNNKQPWHYLKLTCNIRTPLHGPYCVDDADACTVPSLGTQWGGGGGGGGGGGEVRRGNKEYEYNVLMSSHSLVIPKQGMHDRLGHIILYVYVSVCVCGGGGVVRVCLCLCVSVSVCV